MDIGESFIGEGPNAAHISTVIGPRSGPVGTAWAVALATPSLGHTPFVAALQPNVPVQPMTLVINKASIISKWHSEMTWGPAQVGVATGVADAVMQDIIPKNDIRALVIVASIWVSSSANDPEQVFVNNRKAVCKALANGSARMPSFATVQSALKAPHNAFFTASTDQFQRERDAQKPEAHGSAL
ncbi:formaldehyde-activating enzyme [Streptomyces sp. NPDC051133]|uniref:formaldehyde-activating enzyme n=1 Tax=Streptomyces sp. NPDC051133 TaxID=3155521 RepID=UPI003419E25B